MMRRFKPLDVCYCYTANCRRRKPYNVFYETIVVMIAEKVGSHHYLCYDIQGKLRLVNKNSLKKASK